MPVQAHATPAAMVAALSFLTTFATYAAEGTPRPTPVPPIYLSSPEVVKMDWNTRSLKSADIDGDGHVDMAMIDNDSGKIEILYQNNPANPRQKERRAVKRNRWDPVLEDANFWHDGIILGMTGYDMALGDLNGDGLTDIACTGNLNALTVFYQSKDCRWDDTWNYTNFTPMQWPDTVQITDIDGDGRNDLALLADDEFLIFYQDANGKLLEPRRYKLASSLAYALTFADVNGDSLPDVLYMSGTDRYRKVSMRIQQGKGIFGPEVGFSMPNGSIGLAETHATKPPVFATIEGKTRMILTFSLEKGTQPPSSLETLQMNEYTTGITSKQNGLYAWGDFDGDGLTDIAVANPAGAEIILFRQVSEGDFEEGRSYPSLASINSICTLHAAVSGQPDSLVISSDTEECAGIVSISDKGRLSLPRSLPTEGKTMATATGRFENPDHDSIALVEKDKDDNYQLTLLSQNEAGEWVRTSTTKLDKVRRKIDNMLALPALKNGHDLLLLFPLKEAARIFVYAENGFQEKEADSSLRQSTLSSVDPENIGVSDIDSDGVPEILVAGKGFVRALHFTADDKLEVADQYNSRNPEAKIIGPLMIRLAATPDIPRLLFFDSTTENLELLTCDKDDGVFRSIETRENDSEGSIQNLVSIRLGKDAGNALLVMRRERFGIALLNRPGWEKKSPLPPYETDLENVLYCGLCAGDMTGDGVPEILTVDGRENLIDILCEDKNTYRSAMHFVVFDKNQFSDSRSANSLEPRELIVDDFNNDGLNDLAILVHDRVLIYTTEKP